MAATESFSTRLRTACLPHQVEAANPSDFSCFLGSSATALIYIPTSALFDAGLHRK